jgi:hypothetical protein
VNLSSTQTKIPNHINFFNQIPMTDFPWHIFLSIILYSICEIIIK